MSKLFVIGNGFDISHGLKCTYSDFLEYVCLYHHDQFHRIGSMFGIGNPSFLWKDFENNLLSFDVNRSICKNKGLIVVAREHPEKNLDIYTTLANACDGLYSEMQNLFKEWVQEFMKDVSVRPKYQLSTADYYLSFNYTSLLEYNYHIDPSHVCHIHRNAFESESSTPYFGHGGSDNIIESILDLNTKARNAIKEVGACEEDVISVYKQLLVDFKKKTKDRLDDVNVRDFFGTLQKKRIDELVILGHSLGCSDKPYFQELVKYIDISTPIFYSYYSPTESLTIRCQLEDIFHYPDRVHGNKMDKLLKGIY